MVFPMPESSIRISLKYSGSDVDEATMPIEEVISALQGFSGAYGKVASSLLPESQHQLRIAAVQPGSFDLSIVAWITSSQGAETLAAIAPAYKAAKFVFGIVTDYIESKKHVKAKPYQVNIEGSNNTVLLLNMDGVAKEIQPQIADLLKSKLIDKDLEKIVSPLEQGMIDGATLSATDEEETIHATVNSEEKLYFGGDSTADIKQDVTLRGRLVSNNKDTLRGTFATVNGKRVPYHYIGKSPEVFQSVYAFRGNVRIQCIAYSDESLDLKRIEITEAFQIQGELDLT